MPPLQTGARTRDPYTHSQTHLHRLRVRERRALVHLCDSNWWSTTSKSSVIETGPMRCYNSSIKPIRTQAEIMNKSSFEYPSWLTQISWNILKSCNCVNQTGNKPEPAAQCTKTAELSRYDDPTHHEHGARVDQVLRGTSHDTYRWCNANWWCIPALAPRAQAPTK